MDWFDLLAMHGVKQTKHIPTKVRLTVQGIMLTLGRGPVQLRTHVSRLLAEEIGWLVRWLEWMGSRWTSRETGIRAAAFSSLLAA